MYSALSTQNVLFAWLHGLQNRFVNDPEFRPVQVESPFGVHGCMYAIDEDNEEYVTIGFTFPDEIFAEIEDGTYGELQGIRIYLERLAGS
jgi:hypothetical protein